MKNSANAQGPRAAGSDGEAGTALAAIVHERGFDLDGLLRRACDELAADGLMLGGLLHVAQSEAAAPRDCCTILQVADIATGKTFEIWQDLGAEAGSCRLDERGLAEAVPAVMAAIARGVDLLVINRFGKAESRGGGLVSLIAAAQEAGIPVLTAVREPYGAAWRAFHGGLAVDLGPDLGPVLAWCRGVAGRAPAVLRAGARPAAGRAG